MNDLGAGKRTAAIMVALSFAISMALLLLSPPAHSAVSVARRIVPNSAAQRRLMTTKARTVIWSSRVRRGKSYGLCASRHMRALALPGLEIAITRLERASMENTTLVTLRDRIIGQELWGFAGKVDGYDVGWRESKSTFYYPPVRCDDGNVRQSRISVFGWADPGRSLSAEFGDIGVDQAEQLLYRHYSYAVTRLSQNDAWITARAERLGLTPQQIVLICNPEDDQHWIAREFAPDSGARVVEPTSDRPGFEVLLSDFADNSENLSPEYQLSLEALKGTVYYDRLVLGKWARAEGLVYPMFDSATHIVEPPAAWAAWGGYPPPSWPRYRAIDFGYRNPFVCLWAAESPDGVLYVYRQIYKSERIVADHAEQIVKLEAEETRACRAAADERMARENADYLDRVNVHGCWADHDAEDAATLARGGVWSVPAVKETAAGKQAVIRRLNTGSLLVVRGSLVERDGALAAQKLPTCLEQEIVAYRHADLPKSSVTRDENRERAQQHNDHAMDALRYMCLGIDSAVRVGMVA